LKSLFDADVVDNEDKGYPGSEYGRSVIDETSRVVVRMNAEDFDVLA
jgi:hypothetical protein